MSARRVCLLVCALAGLAVGTVQLRSEQARCAARLLRVESQWIELRRERWALQTRAARLRAPQRLRERIESLPGDLVAPWNEGDGVRAARLTADRR